MKKQVDDQDNEKEIRRKKFQEKTEKIDKNNQTISHELKKEFKKKKLEIDEEEWEDWERYYNR
jgi:hypothetical protein